MEFQPRCGLQNQSEKRGLAILFSDVAESFISSHIHSFVFLCVNQRLKGDKNKNKKQNKNLSETSALNNRKKSHKHLPNGEFLSVVPSTVPSAFILRT